MLKVLNRHAKLGGYRHEVAALMLMDPIQRSGLNRALQRSQLPCALYTSSQMLCGTVKQDLDIQSIFSTCTALDVQATLPDGSGLQTAIQGYQTLLAKLGSASRHGRLSAMVLERLAALYSQENQPEMALRMTNEAIPLRETLAEQSSEELVELIRSKLDQAHILTYLGQWSQAKASIDAAIRAVDKSPDLSGHQGWRADLLCRSAQTLEQSAEFEQAINLLEEAVRLYESLACSESQDAASTTRREVQECNRGVERCTSILVQTALQGMSPQDWAKREYEKECARRKEEAVRIEQSRNLIREKELKRLEEMGGRVLEHTLADGVKVRIVMQGEDMIRHWDEMMESSVTSHRIRQIRMEADRCFEGVRNALKMRPVALEQAKFLFLRARESYATVGATEMIDRLKELEVIIAKVEENEGYHSNDAAQPRSSQSRKNSGATNLLQETTSEASDNCYKAQRQDLDDSSDEKDRFSEDEDEEELALQVAETKPAVLLASKSGTWQPVADDIGVVTAVPPSSEEDLVSQNPAISTSSTQRTSQGVFSDDRSRMQTAGSQGRSQLASAHSEKSSVPSEQDLQADAAARTVVMTRPEAPSQTREGNEWSNWWTVDMARVPDKQEYAPTPEDAELEEKRKMVERKLQEEMEAQRAAYLKRKEEEAKAKGE